MGSKRIKKGKDGAELNSPNECMRNVPYKFRNNFKRKREKRGGLTDDDAPTVGAAADELSPFPQVKAISSFV